MGSGEFAGCGSCSTLAADTYSWRALPSTSRSASSRNEVTSACSRLHHGARVAGVAPGKAAGSRLGQGLPISLSVPGAPLPVQCRMPVSPAAEEALAELVSHAAALAAASGGNLLECFAAVPTRGTRAGYGIPCCRC